MFPRSFYFFFFNDTATTEIYTLSLHDALPIFIRCLQIFRQHARLAHGAHEVHVTEPARENMHVDDVNFIDRKSTRLNSSHQIISYAVFCLKKKKNRSDRVTPNTPVKHTTSCHR